MLKEMVMSAAIANWQTMNKFLRQDTCPNKYNNNNKWGPNSVNVGTNQGPVV